MGLASPCVNDPGKTTRTIYDFKESKGLSDIERMNNAQEAVRVGMTAAK